MKCWNCQKPVEPGPVCDACGKVLPPRPGATRFDLFGLPARYELDVPALEQRFRELSLKVHPDRMAQADPRERRFALEQSTALNDAFKTLKDPVRRAFYVLKLAGVDLDREDAGAQKDVPVDLLEEVMTLREELHEAVLAKDVAKAQAMGALVEQRRQAALAEAISAFRALDGHKNPTQLQKASHALARVRYFTRFLEEVEALEDEALS